MADNRSIIKYQHSMFVCLSLMIIIVHVDLSFKLYLTLAHCLHQFNAITPMRFMHELLNHTRIVFPFADIIKPALNITGAGDACIWHAATCHCRPPLPLSWRRVFISKLNEFQLAKYSKRLYRWIRRDFKYIARVHYIRIS